MSNMDRYILALDQGTTSSRAIVFASSMEAVGMHQVELPQIYPQPGWVEHDPLQIWDTQITAARGALRAAGVGAADIATLGISNQRETVVAWERSTGEPLHNAIVWQCRRTAARCDELRLSGLEALVRSRTGLVLDPYFAATKMAWLLEHLPGLRRRADGGEICMGTVDSWLLFRLTGHHLTDASNASRTLLYDIHAGRWDEELAESFGVPLAVLPEVRPSSGLFGPARPGILGASIPVCGVAGDQQAALFGQASFTPGSAKITFGTGCFTLMHTGSTPVAPRNDLLTTVAWDLGRGPEYALEGAVFVAGAVVQWLRDELRFFRDAADSEKLAGSSEDTGGVYMVPAFTGLGSPHWDPHVRGAIFGLTRGTSRSHITRAALESIAFQNCDLIRAMEEDTGSAIPSVRADGGASANALLMQFQADLFDRRVSVPHTTETTALGAAYLAGLSSGFWSDTAETAQQWKPGPEYVPAMEPERRASLLEGWRRAVAAARAFTSPPPA